MCYNERFLMDPKDLEKLWEKWSLTSATAATPFGLMEAAVYSHLGIFYSTPHGEDDSPYIIIQTKLPKTGNYWLDNEHRTIH